MWKIKTFKTSAAMRRFIETHPNIQYQEVFINQANLTQPRCAIEYRPLRIIRG